MPHLNHGIHNKVFIEVHPHVDHSVWEIGLIRPLQPQMMMGFNAIFKRKVCGMTRCRVPVTTVDPVSSGSLDLLMLTVPVSKTSDGSVHLVHDRTDNFP